jgi:predicted dehydrogenase
VDGSAGRGLRVAVAGTGAFGRNHLRVYQDLAAEGITLAAAIEPDDERAAEVAEKYDVPVFA